nr:glycosyltransferase [Melioribacter roseus]
MVGEGEEKNNLMKKVNKLNLTNNVLFVGNIDHEYIANYYNLADIFLSFYDYSNAGNPLFEAMLFSKCIVTLNNGDTSKFIDNNSGVLFNEYNEINISNKIIELLNDDNKRKTLGKNARNRIITEFYDWNERIKIEIDAIKGIIN